MCQWIMLRNKIALLMASNEHYIWYRKKVSLVMFDMQLTFPLTIEILCPSVKHAKTMHIICLPLYIFAFHFSFTLHLLMSTHYKNSNCVGTCTKRNIMTLLMDLLSMCAANPPKPEYAWKRFYFSQSL